MSTLVTSNISDGTTSVGTSYVVNGSAKAWANLNGQGTIALRDSFNISSATDNGTGDYSFNFVNNMSSANSSTSCGVVGGSRYSPEITNGASNANVIIKTPTSSSNTIGTVIDTVYVAPQISGDLA